jgi:hypothetical protein
MGLNGSGQIKRRRMGELGVRESGPICYSKSGNKKCRTRDQKAKSLVACLPRNPRVRSLLANQKESLIF